MSKNKSGATKMIAGCIATTAITFGICATIILVTAFNRNAELGCKLTYE